MITDDGRRLRLADDQEGVSLWPTEAEMDRDGRTTADAEMERLRAELDRLRAK